MRDEPLQERLAERPADDRGVVQDLARRRVEAVEPCLESSLDEGRDGELGLVDGEVPASVLATQDSPLDEVPESLLEEERVAARTLREELLDGLGQLPLRRVRDEDAAGIGGKRP